MTSDKSQQHPTVYFKGSCACKRITFDSLCLPLSDGENCYCVSCRKLSGTSHMTFVFFDNPKQIIFYDNQDGLRYEGLPKDSYGGIAYVRLSGIADRAACKDCHSPIAMRYAFQAEQRCSLMLSAVDEGSILDDGVREALRPKANIFVEQKPWWVDVEKTGLLCHERYGGGFEEVLNASHRKAG